MKKIHIEQLYEKGSLQENHMNNWDSQKSQRIHSIIIVFSTLFFFYSNVVYTSDTL